MEQEVSTAPNQFTEASPVKVLFIKLTTENMRCRSSLWPEHSSVRYIAAEVEASNSYQRLSLNLLKSAEAIFFIFEQEEFSNKGSKQEDNLLSWLKTIEKHDGFNDAKQFWINNALPNTHYKTDFSRKILSTLEEANNNKTVPLELEIKRCEYPGYMRAQDSQNAPMDQSVFRDKPEIFDLLEKNFSQRFASSPLPPPKPPRIASKQSLKRSIEIAFYAGFLFLSTLGVVILLGAILGGASESWTDIIASSSSWIFDVNLLNNAIEAVFNGVGTSWSLGVVISAFLVAGLVAAVVVSWGAYDHFHPEISPVEDINGEGWEITESSDSTVNPAKNSEVLREKPYFSKSDAVPASRVQSDHNLNKS